MKIKIKLQTVAVLISLSALYGCASNANISPGIGVNECSIISTGNSVYGAKTNAEKKAKRYCNLNNYDAGVVGTACKYDKNSKKYICEGAFSCKFKQNSKCYNNSSCGANGDPILKCNG